jgi:CDP-paratose 2-epimerase
MRLLITGGCGFLCSNLALHALARGDDLIVFDNLSRVGSSVNLEWLRSQGAFKFVHGDIRNRSDVDRVFAEYHPDAVFHLAGQVAMTTSITSPRTDFDVNAGGTLNVLEAVRAFVPKSIVVYSSTNKVYGDLEQYTYEEDSTRYVCVDRPTGYDETTPLDFHSPYGCSKGAADQYVLDYSRIYDLNGVVFRHSSMYGGRQFATYDQGWIGWFCQQALEYSDVPESDRSPIEISGSGKQVRDVLHAEDMVRLYFSVFERIERVRGEVFNVGGGMANSLSLLELLDWLGRRLGAGLEYKRLEKRKSDQRIFVADISKAQRLLEWSPQVSKEVGIEKMLMWLKGAAPLSM